MADLFAGDIAKKKKQIQKDKSVHQAFLNDIKATFSPPHGRRVLEKLAESGMVFTGTFTGNSRTYYNEGGRDFIMGLLDLVAQADADTYLHIYRKRIEFLQNNLIKE